MTTRTNKQNAAIHVYLRHLAKALNDGGFDMKEVLKPSVDIPWNEEMAKDFLWRPIQEAMGKGQSTTEIETIDPSDIYLVLSRHISEKFGVYVPFPSIESNREQEAR